MCLFLILPYPLPSQVGGFFVFLIGVDMLTILDVVNACLATMGESPLNTLAEPHEFRGSAQKALERANRKLQATGWWFNEEAITLDPAPLTGHIQLPGDVLKFQSGTRKRQTLVPTSSSPWIVQRGTRLYDQQAQSFTITAQVVGSIVREVPFEDLPPVMAEYVASLAVFRFQSNFDADNSKRQELAQDLASARVEANSEDVRQRRVNFLNNNSRLARIKRATRRYA